MKKKLPGGQSLGCVVAAGGGVGFCPLKFYFFPWKPETWFPFCISNKRRIRQK